MHLRKMVSWLLVSQAIGWSATAVAQAPEVSEPLVQSSQSTLSSQPAQSSPVSAAQPAGDDRRQRMGRSSEALLRSIESMTLHEVAAEVLERNPEIARAKHLAAAAAVRAPQVRALPDPVAALTIFALPAETRAGPQRLSASISQRLPWFGKLALAEQVALFHAAAAEAEVEEIRLDKLTEIRRLAYEMAFHVDHQAIVEEERKSLVRYERAAQARYASGTGLQQEIVRIQTQITRVDTQLLEIAEHHVMLGASLNRLRDRPADAPFGVFELPEFALSEPGVLRFDRTVLRRDALTWRPELAAAAARVAAGETLIQLAEKGFRPDVTLGLSYTAVGRRDDTLGRLQPPEDNGDDILALTGSLNLPVWRRKLEAGVEEARASRWAAENAKRYVLAQVESSIGDLTARMPLFFQHLNLLETVLLKQAREALRSAETAYSTGKLNAVDLLDAEVVLFEVRIAAARTRTDLAVAWAQLERAVGRPVQPLKATTNEENESNS